MLYKDQHTPWKPNQLVFDVNIPLDADFLVGSSQELYISGEYNQAEVVESLAMAALTANYLIIKSAFESQGGKL